MRFARRAAILAGVAIAGLAPIATATAATQAAAGHLRLVATVAVGGAPIGVAADPAT